MNSCIMNGVKVERRECGRIYVDGEEFIDKRLKGEDACTALPLSLIIAGVLLGSALTNLVYLAKL